MFIWFLCNKMVFFKFLFCSVNSAELPLEKAGIQKISMFSGALGPDILPAELEQRRTCTTCHARGVPDLFELW